MLYNALSNSFRNQLDALGVHYTEVGCDVLCLPFKLLVGETTAYIYLQALSTGNAALVRFTLHDGMIPDFDADAFKAIFQSSADFMGDDLPFDILLTEAGPELTFEVSYRDCDSEFFLPHFHRMFRKAELMVFLLEKIDPHHDAPAALIDELIHQNLDILQIKDLDHLYA